MLNGAVDACLAVTALAVLEAHDGKTIGSGALGVLLLAAAGIVADLVSLFCSLFNPFVCV
jgi:hypothetical protein